MKLLKGFVTLQALISNVPGETAVLGELSPLGRTYSREIGEYTNPNVPGYILHSMYSVDSDVAGIIPPTNEIANLTISVAKAAYVYGTVNARPLSTEDFVNSLMVGFYGVVSDIEIGRFIDNGTIQMPEWISWSVVSSESAGGQLCKIWLCDESFLDQYDEYEIIIVPPVGLDELDVLFSPLATVTAKLTEIGDMEKMENIQLAKDGHPETTQKLLIFELKNALYPTSTVLTSWNLLIYGAAGTNIDIMKEAISDYIAAHTQRLLTEWESLIPDLYTRTEFVILPRWDQYAIPDMDVMSGLYNAIQSVAESLAYAKSKISFYEASHIEQNLSMMPYDYRNLMLLVVNGSKNIFGKETIQKVQLDYLSIPTTSPDFNRMTVQTQNWVLLIGQMLLIAESMTKFTSVPRNMRKLYRQGQLYLSTVYDGVNYLILPKKDQ